MSSHKSVTNGVQVRTAWVEKLGQHISAPWLLSIITFVALLIYRVLRPKVTTQFQNLKMALNLPDISSEQLSFLWEVKQERLRY